MGVQGTGRHGARRWAQAGQALGAQADVCGLAGGRCRQLGARGRCAVGAQACGAGDGRRAGAGAGARQAGAKRARRERPGRASWPWAVYSVHSACFWPGSTRYFPESNFWTLFVNPVHEHCSSQIFFGKKIF